MRVNGNDKKRDESIVRIVVVPGLAWNDSMQAAADSSQQLESVVVCLSQAMACSEMMSEQVLLGRVREAIACHQRSQVSNEMRYMRKSKNECSETEEYVCFLHDSGSNAHLSNKKTVFEKGYLKKCDINVFGINENESISAMHASWCGDVMY